MAIANAVGIPFNTPFDFSAWWASHFTGIPIAYGGNPLLPNNAMFRSMILNSGIYHLFKEKSYGTIPYWKIHKRTSTDGIAFTLTDSAALFAAGGAGEFDEWGQADPTVIYDGVGDWKMWFDALKGDGFWNQLGYATSLDGITWTKYGAVLTRGTGGAWDNKSVHHPCCVKNNGIYYLYYSGAKIGDADIVRHTGLAISPDGINWTKEPTNPVISAGTTGEWDDYYIRPSCPILIYGTWYMWYWGFDGAIHSIGLATSKDLIHWTKQGQVYSDTNGSGNHGILFEGSNPLDKIIALYYTEPTLNSMRLATITIPSLLTKLSQFVLNEIRYGDQTAGTIFTAHSANYIYFQRITVTETITPDAIRVYFKSGQALKKYKLALYDNLVATPKNLLGITEEKGITDLTADTWNTWNFVTPPTLPPSDYWIAMWSDGAWQSEKQAGGANNWGNLSLAYGTFPNPVTATTTSAYDKMDMYIIQYRDNVYDIALVTEPTNVYFNNIKGNKVGSIALVNSEFDWFWVSNVLYVYSTLHPDIRYQITYE